MHILLGSSDFLRIKHLKSSLQEDILNKQSFLEQVLLLKISI